MFSSGNGANEDSVEGNNVHQHPAFYNSISKTNIGNQMHSVNVNHANNKDLASSSIYSSS